MSIPAKHPRTRTPAPKPPARSTYPQPTAAPRPDAQHALDECIAATSLIEVTLHSLDAQTLATPEQEVLKKALQAIWSVYGWIDGLGVEDGRVRGMAELVQHAGRSNSLMAEKKARP